MSRQTREIEPDICYHVLNRGNNRRKIFLKRQDYTAFVEILDQALKRYEVELFSWCLMPNHWHLVVRPKRREALQKFIQWVTVTHVRRYQKHYSNETGHLYQGRYKAFPVEEDNYFLTLCRYVEGNALRAGLVKRAESWLWSSLHARIARQNSPVQTQWPVDCPADWASLVNEILPQEQMEQLKSSLTRQRPLGSTAWIRRISSRLNLQHTLASRGRPRKQISELSIRQVQRRRAEPTRTKM